MLRCEKWQLQDVFICFPGTPENVNISQNGSHIICDAISVSKPYDYAPKMGYLFEQNNESWRHSFEKAISIPKGSPHKFRNILCRARENGSSLLSETSSIIWIQDLCKFNV